MKFVAVAVVVCIVLAPLVMRIVYSLASKGKDLAEEQIQTPLEINRVRKIRRWFVIANVLYFLLLISSVGWAFFVFTAGTDFDNTVLIMPAVVSVLLCIGSQAWIVFRILRILKKNKIRFPEPGSSTQEIIKWENNYWDIVNPKIWRELGIMIVLLILVLILFIFLIYLFFT